MKLSIRFKLMVLTLGVIILVGGSIALHSVYLGREKIYKGFLKKSMDVTHILSSNVSSDLFVLDVYSMRITLQNLLPNPELREAYVLDTQGIVLTDGTGDNPKRDQRLTDPFSREIVNADDLIFLRDGEILRMGGPVLMADGTHIGFVYLMFSLDGVTQLVRDSTQASIFITLLFLGVGALLAYCLSKSFTRPILEAGGIAREIGQGKFDARVKTGSQDELGQLGTSINQLAADLSKTTISRDYFDKIITSMVEMLIVVDPAFKIQTVNTATCNELGYRADALIKHSLGLVLPEGQLQEIRERVAAETAWSGETYLLTKEGIQIPVSLSVSSFQDNKKHFSGIVFVAQNITNRKRVEKALKLTQFSIDHASDPIYFMGSDARFFYVNDAACQTLGYSRNELLRMSVYDINPDTNVEEWPVVWANLKKRGTLRIEGRHQTKEGRTIPVEITANYISFQGKEYNCAYARDLTEHRRLEEELRHSQKLEGIGQLAGGVAHEFNNLLAAIIGNLNTVMSDMEDDMSDLRLLRDADQAANRAATLTQQLLAFSRRHPYHLQPQNLRHIVDEATNLLRQTFDRRIELRVESPDDPWNIMADTDSVHQALVNLCVNARDALRDRLENLPTSSSDWSPMIAIRIENRRLDEEFCQSQSDMTPGEYVYLSVSDNGPGIDKRIRDKIFDPFFTTKDVGKGTGLGLASVYGIVKQHHGWINLTQREGGGTTFGIYLPRTTAPIPIKDRIQKQEPVVLGGNETIMLVDDEPVLRQLGQNILEQYGYKVILAEDGEEALKTFSEHGTRINLIVLDLTMPKLSGWEVIRKLSCLSPCLKIIVLSGHRISDQANGNQTNCLVEYMMKPYQPKELAQKVRKILDRDNLSSTVTR